MKIFLAGIAPPLADVLLQYFTTRDNAFTCIEIGTPHLPRATADDCSIVIADAGGQLAGAPLAFDFLGALVDGCRTRGWPLLLLSDSRVFPPSKSQRYRERDMPEPACAAGEQLRRCEQYLAENGERHIILRTGPLLAARGRNLLTDLIAQMRAGADLHAAGEPRFAPTPVTDLARVLAAICDQVNCAAHCWGVYHYLSADTATPYELAEAALAAAGQYWDLGDRAVLKPDPAAVWGSEFPGLGCQKIRDTFGIQQMQWRKAIPGLMKELHASAQLEAEPLLKEEHP